MNTIVFVETTKSGSSREAIKAAVRLGFYIVLLTENKNFLLQRKEFPDIHRMIHLKSISEDTVRTEIKKLCEQGKVIKAIISFVDPFVSAAAKISNEFCGSAISVESIKKMEDKTATRDALKDSQITPYFQIYNPKEELTSFLDNNHQKFPLIVKSPISKASKDVYLVENSKELEKTMKKLTRLFPSQKILIEEYLDGPQYLVEVIVHQGKVNVVAVIKQEVTKKITFIITGYEIQLFLNEKMSKSLYESIDSIISDLQIENAACHLEIRYVNESWKLIEINPRISGGAMNRMIEEAFGINLVEETIKLYLGLTPDLTRKYAKYIYTHYITINSYGKLIKVIGKNKALKADGVKEVYIKPRKGALLTPPKSMGHRYGYIIATGVTSKEAKANAVKAAKNIKLYLEPI